MTRDRLARGVLAADGLGCATAAGVVLGSERVVASFDPSLRVRWPLAMALGATSALLVAGAIHKQPTNRVLERAAAVNAGWVTACLVGLLLRRPSGSGIALLATTAVLDGAAAIAQLAVRSDSEKRESDVPYPCNM